MTRSLPRPDGFHGKDDASVHWFETVTYIGKSSGNDGGKGVGKIAGFNFLMKNGLGNPHRQVFSFNSPNLHDTGSFDGDL